MLLSEKFARLGLFALAIGAALVVAASADAQSPTETPKPHPQRKIVPPPQQSVAPGVEMQTSGYEPVGLRNRYFTETIGPGVTGSFGQNGRDGQPLPLPDSSVLKFGF